MFIDKLHRHFFILLGVNNRTHIPCLWELGQFPLNIKMNGRLLNFWEIIDRKGI